MTNPVEKDYLVVAQNASGRNMHVPLYRITGKQPGPKVYIQSSIHGAEVQGNVVIYHLLRMLRELPLKGEVLLVPNCNPVGTNIKVGEYTMGRFDPINGTNWNRGYFYDPELVDQFAESLHSDMPLAQIKQQFRDWMRLKLDHKLAQPWGIPLAQHLNLKLQQLAFDADVVIDLHNGPVSTRHVYVPEYARSAASLFNIPHVILIPDSFAGALDEATFCPWWRLQRILGDKHNRQYDFGVEAFTLEMGSQEVISFDEGEFDASSILTYLSHRNCLANEPIAPLQMRRIAVTLDNYKVLYTRQGGIVDYIAKPGQHIGKGELLARVLNVDELENDRAAENLYAPQDLVPILHFPSASVLSGTQLYKCFVNYFEI